MYIQQAQPKRMRMAGIEVSKSTSTSHECGGCGKRIKDRYLLKAVDMYWHEDCLKCGCCDCRLGEVGSTLYKKANLLLCKRDYLRLFGTTGHCAACNKVIPAFEMVMRAKTNVYHLECFACQQCNHRFCVGDRFYLCDNKILCEYDYEERLVFANMSYSSDSLAHIKRQVSGIQQPPDDSGIPPPPQPTLPQQHAMPPQQPPPLPPHQQGMMFPGPSSVHQMLPGPSCSMSGPNPGGPTNSMIHNNIINNDLKAAPPPFSTSMQSSSVVPPAISNTNINSSSMVPGCPTSLGTNGGSSSMMGPVGGSSMVGGGGGGPPQSLGGQALPNTPNGGMNGGADDASSGYGSPDSMTLEDR